MELQKIKNSLQLHRNKLDTYNVEALFVFGSVARKEERSDSDIDIMVEFQGPSTFDDFMDLKFFLEDLFSCKIDLVTKAGIRPEICESVEKDLVRVA